MTDLDRSLSRTVAQEAVGPLGWRYLLGHVSVSLPVVSLEEAAAFAASAVAAAGDDADEHLRVDLRPDRVELSVGSWATGGFTSRDVEAARRVAGAWEAGGLRPSPSDAGSRPVQALEIAIDTLDIPAIRPFWRAVLGYVDEPGTGDGGAVMDGAGQLPTIWFQPMDAPRPQRNRIHFDITVAHDEAARRIDAALAAGGHLVSDAEAPAFWILADPEGNEICVCTWQGRDPA